MTLAPLTALTRRRPRRTTRPTGVRRGGRARAAVFAGILAFLGGQAALNVAIRTDRVPVGDPVWSEKFNLLRTRPEFFAPPDAAAPPRVLALGSSRTQLGFAATAFAVEVKRDTGRDVAAFNFGCPAAGPMTAALYLRRLLDAGAKPDVVLVEVHPGFCSQLDPAPPYESRWLHAYRLRPQEVPRLRGYGWAVEPPPHHGWRGWVSAAYSYRMALLNHYAPVMLACPYGLTLGGRVNPDGWVPGAEVKPADKPRALERTHAEYAPTFADYRPGGPGVQAVRDVLTVCREHGIRTAVVLMPESSEYRGWYGAGLGRVRDLADGLGREFAVPVVDGREWVADDGFADGHHLTARGAGIFTRRLAAAVGPWTAGVGMGPGSEAGR